MDALREITFNDSWEERRRVGIAGKAAGLVNDPKLMKVARSLYDMHASLMKKPKDGNVFSAWGAVSYGAPGAVGKPATLRNLSRHLAKATGLPIYKVEGHVKTLHDAYLLEAHTPPGTPAKDGELGLEYEMGYGGLIFMKVFVLGQGDEKPYAGR